MALLAQLHLRIPGQGNLAASVPFLPPSPGAGFPWAGRVAFDKGLNFADGGCELVVVPHAGLDAVSKLPNFDFTAWPSSFS